MEESKLFTPPKQQTVYTSDPEPWYGLCAAIIRRACEDYMLKDPHHGRDDVIRFFQSSWFLTLSKSMGDISGEAIVAALQKNMMETGSALLPVWEPDTMKRINQNRRSKEYYARKKKGRDENG